jgi:hypothetical protein
MSVAARRPARLEHSLSVFRTTVALTLEILLLGAVLLAHRLVRMSPYALAVVALVLLLTLL